MQTGTGALGLIPSGQDRMSGRRRPDARPDVKGKVMCVRPPNLVEAPVRVILVWRGSSRPANCQEPHSTSHESCGLLPGDSVPLGAYNAMIPQTATYLTGDRNLLTVLQSYRACRAIRVVEYDGNACFRDTRLAALVNEVLLVLCAHLTWARLESKVRHELYQKHTDDMFVIPRTKHIASSMLDLPDPLRPVIALKELSQPVICVRTGYDLKPRVV